MPIPRAAFGLLLAFLAYTSWGLLAPVGKFLLDAGAYGPLGLNAVRFAIATALVLLAIGREGRAQTWRVMARRDVLWFNLLSNASLTLFLYSLVTLPAAYATLGFYTAPLWTALWAWVRLGERVGHSFLPAAAGLLAGGFVTMFGFTQQPPAPGGGVGGMGTAGPGTAAGDVHALGLSLAVASGLVWAFYTVSLRRSAQQIALKPLMGASFTLGTLYFLVLALAVEGPVTLWQQTGTLASSEVGWLALYVAIPTLASFILFNASLQRAQAGAVNLLVGAELAFTVLFSWLLFDASYNQDQVMGSAIVVASVTAYLWIRSRPARPPAPTPLPAEMPDP